MVRDCVNDFDSNFFQIKLVYEHPVKSELGKFILAMSEMDIYQKDLWNNKIYKAIVIVIKIDKDWFKERKGDRRIREWIKEIMSLTVSSSICLGKGNNYFC